MRQVECYQPAVATTRKTPRRCSYLRQNKKCKMYFITKPSINQSINQWHNGGRHWVPLYPYLDLLNSTSNYLILIFKYKLRWISDSGKFSCVIKHNTGILIRPERIQTILKYINYVNNKIWQTISDIDYPMYKTIFSNIMIKKLIKQLEAGYSIECKLTPVLYRHSIAINWDMFLHFVSCDLEYSRRR